MTVLFRFAIVFISIFIFSTTHATDRSNDTAVLDVDASGEVDALTDGLLLLRSMFGLSDDALTTGVVSPDCVDCDATKISQYITSVEGKTYADLNSTDDQNISGSSFDGTTLTIGIENGQSETVDLSSLEDGTGITAEQASAIEANTAKVGITATQADAIAANTAKTGITADQAEAITANTAKTGITADQAAAIVTNSQKIGINIVSDETAISSTDFTVFGTTTGNIGLGYSSLLATRNSTGIENTAIGVKSLMQNEQGDANVAIGFLAMGANSGSANTAVGRRALQGGTGNYNVAVGNSALSSSDSGTNNVAVGASAMGYNSTGSEGVAVGFQALYNNTSGSANVGIGFQSQFRNEDGDYNVSVGRYSLYWNEGGHFNSAIGEEALALNTSGESNTASGYRALISNTSGAYNTGIGAYADVESGAITNSTAIGYGAVVAESNSIQLGNASVNNVKTSGTITAGAITIPNTDGADGQVLATDGSGTLAWTTKTEITSDQANQLSAAMSALTCISTLAPPGADDEEEEHADEDHSDDSSYPEFWINTQSCIKDAFAGI